LFIYFINTLVPGLFTAIIEKTTAKTNNSKMDGMQIIYIAKLNC